MKAITITSYPSMPWRYRVFGPGPIKTRWERDAGDAGEAAAVALSYAGAIGAPYVIIGPRAVVDQIPVELRSK